MNKENIHTATDTSNVGVAAVSDEGVLDACLKFEEVPIFDVTTFKPSENLTGLLNKIVASKPQEIDVGFSDNSVLVNATPFNWVNPPPPEYSLTPVDYNEGDQMVELLQQLPIRNTGISSASNGFGPRSNPRTDTELANLAPEDYTPLENQKMDASTLKRAWALVNDSFANDPAVREKASPDTDRINIYILHLRNENGLGWGDIAAMLNSQPDTFTSVVGTDGNESIAQPFNPTNVYSRYVRTQYRLRVQQEAEGIALRENDKRTKRREAAARNRRQGTAERKRHKGASESANDNYEAEPEIQVGPFNEQMDKFLVEAYGEVRKEFWEMVARRIMEKGSKKTVEPGECARRWYEL